MQHYFSIAHHPQNQIFKLIPERAILLIKDNLHWFIILPDISVDIDYEGLTRQLCCSHLALYSHQIVHE